MGLVETSRKDDQPPWNPRQKREQNGTSFSKEIPTMAELLRTAGYRTAAFVDQPALHISSAYRRGFDEVFFPSGIGVITRIGSRKKGQSWPEVRHAHQMIAH